MKLKHEGPRSTRSLLHNVSRFRQVLSTVEYTRELLMGARLAVLDAFNCNIGDRKFGRRLSAAAACRRPSGLRAPGIDGRGQCLNVSAVVPTTVPYTAHGLTEPSGYNVRDSLHVLETKRGRSAEGSVRLSRV